MSFRIKAKSSKQDFIKFSSPSQACKIILVREPCPTLWFIVKKLGLVWNQDAIFDPKSSNQFFYFFSWIYCNLTMQNYRISWSSGHSFILIRNSCVHCIISYFLWKEVWKLKACVYTNLQFPLNMKIIYEKKYCYLKLQKLDIIQ